MIERYMEKSQNYPDCIDWVSIFANWSCYDLNIRAEAKKHKYVVFFGVGVIFPYMVDTWNASIEKKIDFCCDNNSSKWGNFYNGIECISYEKLLEIKDETVIFLTIGDFIPVHKQLKDAGFATVKIIYKYDLEAGPYIRASNLKNLAKEAETARSLLSDTKSKKIFDSIIFRSSGVDNDLMLMPSIFENNQYYPNDLFDLSCDESYVDVGAYDGDTINTFLLKCNNQFDKIYAFELNNKIFNKLENNLSNSKNLEQIKIFNVGAWDKNQKISYKAGNFNSAIGEGEEVALVAPLDEMLYGVKVTYIKMDIEGAEIKALQGARNIIEKQKPKLAICVYHKISHLWEIPLLINEMLPDHNIFLRHHTNLEYETVCYALPNNNLTNKL